MDTFNSYKNVQLNMSSVASVLQEVAIEFVFLLD